MIPTWQDFLLETSEGRRNEFILYAIEKYKSSQNYATAIEAEEYLTGENTGITNRPKWIMKKSGKTITFSNNVTISNFFFRCVVQQNQTLLANGLQLKDKEEKKKLGWGFDETLEEIGEMAITHGVCWGFFDLDHLQKFEATQFFALYDERSGEPQAGIRFWQTAPNKPMYVELYEIDGITEFATNAEVNNKQLIEIRPKRAYKQTLRSCCISSDVMGTENYKSFPVVPMYANRYRKSEFSKQMKSKIDLYDKILSDFGDNLERTNDIYWVISNFGGTSDDIKEMLAEIEELRIAFSESDGSGSSAAVPHTIEVPYAARQAALDILEKNIYLDYMAMNMSEIVGGSLTNVAIQTASYNLKLKVNRYEWQVFKFCRKILDLAGIQTEDISFKRETISNDVENIRNVIDEYEAGLLDKRTALQKLPNVGDDEIDEILERLSLEELGVPSENDEANDYSTNSSMDTSEIKNEVKQTVDMKLNGAQTQSLITVLEQYSTDKLTLGQAINIISVAIGISKDEAKKIIEGLE